MTTRDFDPILVASEWHGGQSSALYSYSSTGQIHGAEHRDALLSEIEACQRAAWAATDDDLAELELLRLHITTTHIGDDSMTDAELERIADARVMRRLVTDRAYLNAETAEDQAEREAEITAQVLNELGADWDRGGAASGPRGEFR